MVSRKAPSYAPRSCSECSSEFQPIRVDQHFCSAACRNLEHNRELVRGREVYRAAYHWILSNGKGENAWLLTEVSRMIRRWRDADREEGRAPPPFPVDIIKGVKYGRVSTGRSAKR
jgi:predicted nucleic acid-binding Zn ribbon protein